MKLDTANWRGGEISVAGPICKSGDVVYSHSDLLPGEKHRRGETAVVIHNRHTLDDLIEEAI